MKTKRDMDRTLVAILIGNNIVNIVLSSVAAVIANELFHTLGVTIMVAIITFLIIIFGEITPKSNAIWDTKKVAQNNSKPIYYLTRALSPLISMFMVITKALIRLTGKKIEQKGLLITDEKIKSLKFSFQSIEKDLKNIPAIKLNVQNFTELIKQARLQALISLGDEDVSSLLMSYYEQTLD